MSDTPPVKRMETLTFLLNGRTGADGKPRARGQSIAVSVAMWDHSGSLHGEDCRQPRGLPGAPSLYEG